MVLAETGEETIVSCTHLPLYAANIEKAEFQKIGKDERGPMIQPFSNLCKKLLTAESTHGGRGDSIPRRFIKGFNQKPSF